MKPKLEVKIGKLKLKNPVTVASGTFGYGSEFDGTADIDKLGGIVTKTITLHARVGNKPPRIIETPSGMINSIGLENPGVEKFIKDKLPSLQKYKIPVIASIAGETIKEYSELAGRLDSVKDIAAIEINISCPNIKTSKLFSQDENSTGEVVRAVRSATKKTVITKLSPNVTDIGGIAKSAESAGSDALSLINTLKAMSVDAKTRESRLGDVTGGLSGPAIKPVALFMIWKVYHRVKIPIIGMGGIMSPSDVVEFMLCGSTAVSVGTANFVHPNAAAEAVKGLSQYLKNEKIKDVNKLIGSLKV